jgi:hypothetical protein
MTPEEIASYVISVLESTVFEQNVDVLKGMALMKETSGVIIERLTEIRKAL